jgi:hypothetical protein
VLFVPIFILITFGSYPAVDDSSDAPSVILTSDTSTSAVNDEVRNRENISTNPAPTAKPATIAVPNPELAILSYGSLIF